MRRREPKRSHAGRRWIAIAAVGVPLIALAVIMATQLVAWQPIADLPEVPVPADWTMLPADARQKASDAADECRRRPRDAAAYAELGRIYHGNTQPALAIAAYERAIELDDADMKTTYLLAVLELDWGRLDAASTHLEAVVERRPEYAPAWHNLGRVWLETGDAGRAVPAFRHAVALDGTQPEFHVGLGRALRRGGEYAEAATVLEAALTLDPDHPAAHQLLGLTLRELDRDDESAQHLAAVPRYSADVMADPWLAEAHRHAASVETRVEWARGYLAAGRIDSAVRLLEQLATQHDDRAEVFRRLGEAYTRAGRTTDAATAYRRVLAIEPYDASTRTSLAENLLLRGSLEEAEAEITRATTDDPDDTDTQVIRAAIALRRGHAGEALEQLEVLASARGDHVAAQYWHGETLFALGRFGGAATAYERVLQLRPGLPAAERRLAACRERLGP